MSTEDHNIEQRRQQVQADILGSDLQHDPVKQEVDKILPSQQPTQQPVEESKPQHRPIVTNAGGMEIFHGLDLKYPEYEIITPHTLKSFTIRSLSVQDEERLKASLLTPAKLSEHLNRVIWDCLVQKPSDVQSYEDMLTNLTMKDRDALMYGLYHITYGDVNSYNVQCEKCDVINSVNINFLKSFKMIPWEKNDNVLDYEISTKLKVADKVWVYMKQPLLKHESDLMRDMATESEETRDSALYLLIIDRLEVEQEGTDQRVQIKNRDNVRRAYSQLPATDRKIIEESYFKEFGKYGVEIKSIVNCKGCGHSNNITVDLVQQFFRSLYE